LANKSKTSSGTDQEGKIDKIRRRFTIVDLDPFGSPANYVDCMMRSVEDGGLVSVTATDTAVLCGKHPEVCLRKYYGLPLNNSYSINSIKTLGYISTYIFRLGLVSILFL
jgi:tRNA G26 N,N-dimethylase Trm1